MLPSCAGLSSVDLGSVGPSSGDLGSADLRSVGMYSAACIVLVDLSSVGLGKIRLRVTVDRHSTIL